MQLFLSWIYYWLFYGSDSSIVCYLFGLVASLFRVLFCLFLLCLVEVTTQQLVRIDLWANDTDT